jgi:hypothetical protein
MSGFGIRPVMVLAAILLSAPVQSRAREEKETQPAQRISISGETPTKQTVQLSAGELTPLLSNEFDHGAGKTGYIVSRTFASPSSHISQEISSMKDQNPSSAGPRAAGRGIHMGGRREKCCTCRKKRGIVRVLSGYWPGAGRPPWTTVAKGRQWRHSASPNRRNMSLSLLRRKT